MFLIYGYGITGRSFENFCIKKNFDYLIFDDKKLDIQDNKIYQEKKHISLISTILLSPGIKMKNNHTIEQLFLVNQNLQILSDLELFYQYYKYKDSTKFIGITGTDGKSTTTALINHILSKKYKSISCGNIGNPILSYVDDQYDFLCIECSSYQLEINHNIYFDIGILTNITEDHLEYHENINNYINAKENILKKSKIQIISTDDINTKILSLKYPYSLITSTQNTLEQGFSFIQNDIYINQQLTKQNAIFENMIGKHNKQNIINAVACCLTLELSFKEILESISTFQNLKYRFQILPKIQNVSLINDSKSTNIFTTTAAISAASDIYDNIFLILGGINKEKTLLHVQNLSLFQKVKKIFLIGQSTDLFASELDLLKIQYQKSYTLENAVKIGFEEAKKIKNSVLLFSPACASFDQFKNFEDRGEKFNLIIQNLIIH